MKYRVQVNVITDRDEDTWSGNSLLYLTDTDALAAAVDLSQRWLLVRYYRIVDEIGTVFHTNKPTMKDTIPNHQNPDMGDAR